MIRSANRRSGYTLLEILAASAIGVMLLAALYAAYDLTLRQATIGRDLTTEADLSRAIVHRVGLDLSSTIGVLPPKSGGTPATSSSTSSTSTGTTSGTGTTTGETTTSTSSTTADVPLQAGIVGGGQQLTAIVSKLPKYLAERNIPYDSAIAQPGDLVRITYYLHSSGKGLCRQERHWVTADGIWNSVDPDRSTEEQDLIAPEVVDVQFEFASGTGYVSEWDGATGGTDGSTNQGAPRGVKMTLTLEFVQAGTGPSEPIRKMVSHLYPIRAATGPRPTATTTNSTTTGTGTTGGN
jgi:prepilin-type N-terminal cleavage/methylation domain-containing protein